MNKRDGNKIFRGEFQEKPNDIDWDKRSCMVCLNLLRNIIPNNRNDLEQFVSTLSPEEVSSIIQYADKITTSISRKRRKYKVKIII